MNISRLRKTLVGLAVVALFAVAAAQAQEIKSGEALLQAMHARYANDWYDTLSFVQTSTTHNADGTDKVETWYEAALLPGKLRIDFGKYSEGNGWVFADGHVTSFKAGKVVAERPFVHLLLVLGFDVYKQDPQVTVGQLKADGVDLSKIHEEEWQGKTVYVVGADKGDLKTKQFWIEKERLLFVRLLMPDDKDKTKTRDERFADYRKQSQGWVAARVEFYMDGKLVFDESYYDIVANPKLDPTMYDPKQYTTTHVQK